MEKTEVQSPSTSSSSSALASPSSSIVGSVVVDCPVCGKNCQLSVDDFELLQPNKSLMRIINLHTSAQFSPLPTHTQSSISDVKEATLAPNDEQQSPLTTSTPTPQPQQVMKCEACDRAASIECIACGCLLCEVHDQSIHSAGKLKQHPRFSLELDQDKKNGNSGAGRDARLCNVHGKLRELFCLVDNELICCHCLISDTSAHSAHAYECKSIDYAAVVLRARLDASRQRVVGVLGECRASVGERLRAHEDVQRARDALNEDIDSKVDEVIEMLNNKKRTLKEAVDLFARTKMGIISLQLDEYQHQVTKLEEILSSIQTPSEDLYEFVPRALTIEHELRQLIGMPAIPSVTLSPGFFKELHVDALKCSIESLELSSPPLQQHYHQHHHQEGSDFGTQSKAPLRRAANILSLSLPVAIEHITPGDVITAKVASSETNNINLVSSETNNNNNNNNNLKQREQASSMLASSSPVVYSAPSSVIVQSANHTYLHRAPSSSMVFDHQLPQYPAYSPYYHHYPHPQVHQAHHQHQHQQNPQVPQSPVMSFTPSTNLSVPFTSVAPVYTYTNSL